MITFGLFLLLCIPLALVDNYPGLLILRFLVDFMGSPCLATGGATMQDMYSFVKLPYALTFWVAAQFNGTSTVQRACGKSHPQLSPTVGFARVFLSTGSPIF